MRNITDEMIKEIIKRKGLIGLNLYRKLFRTIRNPKIYFVTPNIFFLLEGRIVWLSVAIGMERLFLRESATFVQELFEMLKNTFSKEIAEKIVYDNAAEFLEVF